MDKEDAESLALLIKYCEDEAVRLAMPAVVIHCLRLANDELVESIVTSLPRVRIDERIH